MSPAKERATMTKEDSHNLPTLGRLIYHHEKGCLATPVPTGRYVYLWAHGDTPRLVGKGQGTRWRDHLKLDVGLRDDLKFRYLRRFMQKMHCYIVAENLTDEQQSALEDKKINEHGLRRIGRDWFRSGTLINRRHAPAFPNAKREQKDKAFQERLLRAVRRALATGDGLGGRIALNAVSFRVTPENPKKRACEGRAFIERCYPEYGSWSPFETVLLKARENGFHKSPQFRPFDHVTWDLTRGILGFEAADEPIKDGCIVPTWEWLHNLALQIGALEEWQAWCNSGRCYGRIGTPRAKCQSRSRRSSEER
jgi:hypothetical protein